MHNIKAIMSKEGIIIDRYDLNDKDYIKIKKNLTYVSKKNINYGNSFIIKDYKKINNKIIIPKFCEVDVKLDIKIEINKLEIDKINIKFNGILKDYQENILKNARNNFFYSNDNSLHDLNCNDNLMLKKYGGSIISIPPGKGKTVIALKLITEIKYRTLIIVHKTFLLDQWKERILEFTNANIGIIHQNNIDVYKKDIVIGMLHSLCLKDYNDIFDSFEFVVFDECHHLGANMFSTVFKKIKASYTLGLSATPDRLDKMEIVFFNNIGKISYDGKLESNNLINDEHLFKTFGENEDITNKCDNKNNEKLKINVIIFTSTDKKLFKPIVNIKTGKIIQPIVITNLSKIAYRNILIVNKIIELLNFEKDRKILVLSSRINKQNQLGEIEKLLIKYNKDFCEKIGYYTGSTKPNQRKISETKQIILASYEMASEGLDIKNLDTLVCATPIKGNKEQIFGRILRKEITEYKYVPLVIDIIDTIDFLFYIGKARIKYYYDKNYEIHFEEYEDNNYIGNKKIYVNKSQKNDEINKRFDSYSYKDNYSD